MSNLLVVDWDYFFPNPIEAGDLSRKAMALFDWGHREDPFMIGPIWASRALGFVMNNEPLATVNDEWREFWPRFKFSENSTLYVADSNMYAGLLRTGVQGDEPYDSVWLFDAHHDCGYHVKDVVEWLQRERFTCEDWMLIHAILGAELHYRSPRWHSLYNREAPILPNGVVLDHRPDDGGPVDVVFDDVFVCRSGAWVPSWCDGQFEEFLQMCPVEGDLTCLWEGDSVRRNFSLDEVHALNRQLEAARAGLDG